MNRIDAIKVIEDIKSLQAKSELTSDQIEAIHTILHNNTPEVIECAQTVSKVASLNLPEQHYSFLITKLFTTSLMIINNDFDIIFINKLCANLLAIKKEKTLLKLLSATQKQTIDELRSNRKKEASISYDLIISGEKGDTLSIEITDIPIENNEKTALFILIFNDISEAKILEEKYKLINEELETTVQKRTKELSITNYHLTNEIKERKIAEIALKISEKRFKDLFYSSPEAIFVEDFEGTILDLNDAAAIMHGRTRDEMIGKSFKDYMPDHEINEASNRQKEITQGILNYFESYIINKNNSKIPVAVKSAIIEYNNGLAILLHSRDISERKKHEEMLQQMNNDLEIKIKQRTIELENEIQIRKIIESKIKKQKDFLNLIIDANPDLFFVFDKTGKYKLVNNSFAAFFGLTVHEILRNYSIDNLSIHPNIKRPSDQQNPSTETFEIKINHPTNRKEIFLKIEKICLIDKDTNEIDTLVIASDLTNTKRAEDRLIKSEYLYRNIARNVPNSAIFIFDKSLNIILAEGPLIGIISPPKEEIEGKHVSESTPSELKEIRTKLYSAIINDELEDNNMIYYENNRYLLVNALPIKGVDNEIIYGMVIVLDITILKLAEIEISEKAKKLSQSNEELERFAYVASHDLQSPLRTITSYLQIIEQRFSTRLDEKSNDFIKYAIEGAKRMQLLITDLLNYSRLNTIPRPFVYVDMNELIYIVSKNLENNIQQKNAEIQVVKLPIIIAEPYKLTQLLQNLIDNALKFITDKKPVIAINYRDRGEYWEFTITDNGIGIKEEFREKIFMIFQRLHTDNEYPGTGIGLAICKKVVDIHKGEIWFKSNGDGTTFYFTISKNLSDETK